MSIELDVWPTGSVERLRRAEQTLRSHRLSGSAVRAVLLDLVQTYEDVPADDREPLVAAVMSDPHIGEGIPQAGPARVGDDEEVAVVTSGRPALGDSPNSGATVTDGSSPRDALREFFGLEPQPPDTSSGDPLEAARQSARNLQTQVTGLRREVEQARAGLDMAEAQLRVFLSDRRVLEAIFNDLGLEPPADSNTPFPSDTRSRIKQAYENRGDRTPARAAWDRWLLEQIVEYLSLPGPDWTPRSVSSARHYSESGARRVMRSLRTAIDDRTMRRIRKNLDSN